MILKGYLFSIGYAFLCLLIGLLVYKIGVPKKYTRKIVHILVGFEWLILNRFFGDGIHLLVVCVFFLGVLFVTYKKNLMPMISSDGENAPGTVYYAVAMTGVAIVSMFYRDVMVPFGIAIGCTSIGDGFAGIIGQIIKRNNPKIYKNKSLYGTLANVAMSFLCAFLISYFFEFDLKTYECLIIAIVAAQLEVVTGYGLDNISITWGITALTCFIVNFDGYIHYIVPILLTIPVIAFVLEKKSLTYGGLVGAIVLDIIVSVTFGNLGFVLLLSFLVLGIVVDKIKAKYSAEVSENRIDRSRSIKQVLANGFAPAVFAILYFVTHNYVFFVGYTASLAEALSDTFGSGIGVFSKRTFDPFRFKWVEKGLSGGMSGVGTLSSLLGSLIICLIALVWHRSALVLLVTFLSGFAGAVFDSFLGSVCQVKYRCSVCKKITEQKEHCGSAAVMCSGIRFVDNNFVNVASSCFAGALAAIIWTVF